MPATTDRIAKEIFLRAPRERVWRAITDSRHFGSWFGIDLAAPFAPGTTVTGKRVPSSVDPDAPAPADWRDIVIVVDAIEPETRFTFRWHPFAHDRAHDYASEPMTSVVFTLAEAPGGVRLTVEESGFDAIPVARRRAAFDAHLAGWPVMLDRVGRYVTDAR